MLSGIDLSVYIRAKMLIVLMCLIDIYTCYSYIYMHVCWVELGDRRTNTSYICFGVRSLEDECKPSGQESDRS